MSNEKFIPGEWEVFHHKDEYMKSFDWREIVTKETPPKAIAHIMYYDGMPQEEYEANAALIAKAPQMYKKLYELYNLFVTFSYRLLQCKENKNAEQWMKKAMEIHKLLKEARGEE